MMVPGYWMEWTILRFTVVLGLHNYWYHFIFHPGTCIDLVNKYTCQCNVGFAGTHCDIIIRNCGSDSCFPGVRCIQKTHTISCDPCPTGFAGNGKNCKGVIIRLFYVSYLSLFCYYFHQHLPSSSQLYWYCMCDS